MPHIRAAFMAAEYHTILFHNLSNIAWTTQYLDWTHLIRVHCRDHVTIFSTFFRECWGSNARCFNVPWAHRGFIIFTSSLLDESTRYCDINTLNRATGLVRGNSRSFKLPSFSQTACNTAGRQFLALALRGCSWALQLWSKLQQIQKPFLFGLTWAVSNLLIPRSHVRSLQTISLNAQVLVGLLC